MKSIKMLLYKFIRAERFVIPAAAAVLLLAGCTQLLQSGTDGYSTVKLVLAPAAGTSAAAESVSAAASARSAYPSSLDSSMLYKVTALESGASSPIDCTVSVSDATLSCELLSGKTWDITVTAYASSDTAYTTPLLTGSASVTLSANQTAASATISLGPADGATGTGTISLQMKDGTTAKTINSITAEYTVAGTPYTTALTGSSSSGWTFSHGTEGTAVGASLTAGTYDVVFYFYDSVSALLGWYADKITVYSGLTTDKWYISGSEGTTILTVTDSMMSTSGSNTYFVSGSGGGFTGSDSNSGTIISKPFATLSAALSAVNSANDGTSSYTIYIDGTLTETEQTADSAGLGYCEQIYPGNNLTVSIIRIGEDAAVLDASAVSGTAGIKLLSVTAGGNKYTVNLTLKGLTMKCPQGSSDAESYGVFADSYFGSGSLLTLEDCTVESDSGYTCPVSAVAGDGGDIPVTISGSKITASGDSVVAFASSATVTLASSDISVTGILIADAIVVNAVPSSAVTVEPYSFDASVVRSAVTLFSSDSTQSVSGTISLFPLWDTTNYYYTDSCKVMQVQTFSWKYDSSTGNDSAAITYAGESEDVFTISNSVTDGQFCTAVDSNGQIYVLYYSGSSYTVYTAGTTYSVDVGSCDLNNSSGSMCVLAGGSLLFSRSSSYSNTLCELTLSGGTYSCSDVTLSDSDYADGPNITSLAAAENGSTQYVFYTYTYTGSEPCIPKLACAVLSGTTLTKEWAESVSISDVYCSNVYIIDMTVGLDGKLYMLLSDKSTVNFLLNGSMYLTNRGALVCAGSAQSLASDTAPSSLSLTPYGWRSSSNRTTQCTASGYESSAISIYASSSNSYTDDQYFTGPVRFLALTPKQIMTADYGIYVDGTSYNSKSGTAVFTLDSSTLDLAATDSGVYGEYTSGTISTYSSSYLPMN